MKAMIDLTVEKLADLQIIRGIVMSEVSELDVLMENIIHKYFVESASEERTQLFHKHITTDVEKSVKRNLSLKIAKDNANISGEEKNRKYHK